MKQSAGILLYKKEKNELRILLAHPGGPFWAKKDEGSWTIPKGELDEGEDALAAARREFEEETGHVITSKCYPLRSLKQKSGKLIHAWKAEEDFETGTFKSNMFEMEWPPRSGKKKSFPEIDKVQWFGVEEALLKILPGQQGFIKELLEFNR